MIQKFFVLTLLSINMPLVHSFSLIIDPSHNNKSIEDEYEHNKSLLYAESIRDYLQEADNTHTVHVTRGPGETVDQLEIATFSNTLHPNLHVSLQFFATSHEPSLYIYFMSYNKNEVSHTESHKLTMLPAWQTYLYNLKDTKKYAQKLYDILIKEYGSKLQIHKPIGCPCKPLFGITAPALVVEIGIPTELEPSTYQEIISQAFLHIGEQSL